MTYPVSAVENKSANLGNCSRSHTNRDTHKHIHTQRHALLLCLLSHDSFCAPVWPKPFSSAAAFLHLSLSLQIFFQNGSFHSSLVILPVHHPSLPFFFFCPHLALHPSLSIRVPYLFLLFTHFIPCNTALLHLFYFSLSANSSFSCPSPQTVSTGRISVAH